MLHDNDGCSAGVLVKNHRAEKFWVLYAGPPTLVLHSGIDLRQLPGSHVIFVACRLLRWVRPFSNSCRSFWLTNRTRPRPLTLLRCLQPFCRRSLLEGPKRLSPQCCLDPQSQPWTPRICLTAQVCVRLRGDISINV